MRKSGSKHAFRSKDEPKGQVLHEVLPVVPGFGLCTLPAPSAGDVFLDFEGDPFVSGGGLEYLFRLRALRRGGGRAYTGSGH